METFVVRVFVPADQDGVPFCGLVEHIGDQRAQRFAGAIELLERIREGLRETVEPGRPADEPSEGGTSS